MARKPTNIILKKKGTKKMASLTLTEAETQAVIEAGLTALGFKTGAVLDMKVIQGRGCNGSRLELETDPLGTLTKPEPKEVVQLEELAELEAPVVVPDTKVVEHAPEEKVYAVDEFPEVDITEKDEIGKLDSALVESVFSEEHDPFKI